MKGIYLAACKSRHFNYDIVYNDIDNKFGCDLVCDMMSIDLKPYDFIIASPPCNFYSRANYRRYSSEYSLKTKHLLPDILLKLSILNKPFIVENVRSSKLFIKEGIFNIVNKYNLNVYYIGRHTYFTNRSVNLECLQLIDFHDSSYAKIHNIRTERQSYRQGGDNVYNVIERWLNQVVNGVYDKPVQTNIFDFL